MNLRRLSLLWKIWLSTSVALTALFAAIGYFIQRGVQQTATLGLQEEVRASLKAYDALWQSKVELFESLASFMSGMPEALHTLEGKHRDGTQVLLESWVRATRGVRGAGYVVLISRNGAILSGAPDAGGEPLDILPILSSSERTPNDQRAGFYVQNSVLHHIVVTPFQGGPTGPGEKMGRAIAGFAVNANVARGLKDSTGSSDFIFVARGQVFASTLPDNATGNVVRNLTLNPAAMMVSDGFREYVPIGRELLDFDRKPVGKLYILRSFVGVRESIAGLRSKMLIIWLGAIVMGLLLTYVAAERIVQPVKDLDTAAGEVAMQNYDYRVAVDNDDELGRLASTFNKMCESLQAARSELIRRERIATIGRLASSIVHDLRNPLAAIYGGSEMLVDTQPTPDQTRRIAENIYRASKRIQELLDDLVRVTRGKTNMEESCDLRQLVREALISMEPAAQAQGVKIEVNIEPGLLVYADRPRIEGVFVNLVQNALDVMPKGGEVRISAAIEGGFAMTEVADTGPGIANEIRSQLFQPFVSHGKKNGLGLGLALARQTLLDHGGDLWAAPGEGDGARFILRIPRQKQSDPVDSGTAAG
ncbi:MAG: HAMP domain-containing histidine kinase [Bryobacterales bacterium]|nr:HAMP domain-containing histidine kinase [Bryobacterales bacterium]